MFRPSLQQTLLFAMVVLAPPVLAAGGYVPWQAEGDTIPQPLGGLQGDVGRGRETVRRKDLGNCLACHQVPITEEPFQGTVGPPLQGVGSRLSAAQIRLRVADESRLVPTTIMPPFHKNPADLNQVADEYYGKPVLSARQVEDVVSYLMTLR